MSETVSAINKDNARAGHPLTRLLAPIEEVSLADPSWDGERPDEGAAVQCRPGGEWELLRSNGWGVYARPGALPSGGRELARFQRDRGPAALCLQGDDGRVLVPFGLADAYDGYTAELHARAGSRRALGEGALNAFYQLKRAIPRSAQLAARRALIRWQGRPEFPSWPMDASVADLLGFWVRCELIARSRRELRFRWFWPGRARAALILTHDVESAAGLRNSIRVADLEEARGLRSSFNIVADEYPIDWGIVGELRDRGFELGVHGVHHDRSMFASRAGFDAQQPALRRMVERLGAEGFRSPATHRVHGWLGELPVSYDCTVPMSDPYEPQPGGCCSPWPYFLGQVVELPWTLPQDHTLFTLLGERSAAVWMDQLEAIEGRCGLAQCLSHPDPGYLGDRRKEAIYADFLDAVADRPGLWRALPREVATWWRKRDGAVEAPAPGQGGVAVIDDSGSVVLGLESAPLYENQSATSVQASSADR